MFCITNIFKNSQKIILNSQKRKILNYFSPSTTTNSPKKLSLPPLKDESLCNEILTHPSASLNSHHIYRRYCFYGDKAYNYFIARELYNKLPDVSNAELTTITHQLVSRNFLAEVAIECGLDKLIKVTKNSPISTGILCENIIVHFAVYILNGMEEEMKKFTADVVDFYFDKERKE